MFGAKLGSKTKGGTMHCIRVLEIYFAGIMIVCSETLPDKETGILSSWFRHLCEEKIRYETETLENDVTAGHMH